MRKPTQNEINLAPSWAVSYSIGDDDLCTHHERHYGFTLPLPPKAPSKEFDISEHVFECKRFSIEDGDVELENGYETAFLTIDKDDAIALAKHFKLTAEDLL